LKQHTDVNVFVDVNRIAVIAGTAAAIQAARATGTGKRQRGPDLADASMNRGETPNRTIDHWLN
jgi:hypothetical protein